MRVAAGAPGAGVELGRGTWPRESTDRNRWIPARIEPVSRPGRPKREPPVAPQRRAVDSRGVFSPAQLSATTRSGVGRGDRTAFPRDVLLPEPCHDPSPFCRRAWPPFDELELPVWNKGGPGSSMGSFLRFAPSNHAPEYCLHLRRRGLSVRGGLCLPAGPCPGSAVGWSCAPRGGAACRGRARRAGRGELRSRAIPPRSTGGRGRAKVPSAGPSSSSTNPSPNRNQSRTSP